MNTYFFLYFHVTFAVGNVDLDNDIKCQKIKIHLDIFLFLKLQITENSLMLVLIEPNQN